MLRSEAAPRPFSRTAAKAAEKHVRIGNGLNRRITNELIC